MTYALLAFLLLPAVISSDARKNTRGGDDACSRVSKQVLIRGLSQRSACEMCMEKSCSWCARTASTTGGKFVGICRSNFDISSKCESGWTSASFFSATATNSAKCASAYNSNGTPNEEAASVRAAKDKTLSGLTTGKSGPVDSGVYQGSHTTMEQIRKDDAYLKVTNKRAKAAKAECKTAKWPKECISSYNSRHPPPPKPANMGHERKSKADDPYGRSAKWQDMNS